MSTIKKKLLERLSNNLFEIIVIGLLAGILFVCGTYFPNDYAKKQIESSLLDKVKHIGFFEPKITNHSPKEFVESLGKCVEYINLSLDKKQHIAFEIIAAQAIIESDYGTSRFAVEGQNLFGIREWSKNGILPSSYKETLSWRVKVFNTKCSSVKYYINNLNESHHYNGFRDARSRGLSVYKQVEHLSVYATNKDYVNKIKGTIKYIKDKKYI
jgi:Bax protein